MQEIRIGSVQGETPTQIVRRINGTRTAKYADGSREVTRRGLQSLVQTASSHISNRARQAWAESTGVFENEIYTAVLDSLTTIICGSLDGKLFPVGKGPTPPLHFNCRSVRIPIIDGTELDKRPANRVRSKDLEGLKGDARQKKIRELVGQVPGDTKFETFLSRQTKSWQDDYLGTGRAELWRKGNLTLKQLIDQRGKRWTLAELRVREGLN